MTFHSPAAPRRRVAIIGGGISGMAAAEALAPDHDVTLFEAEPRLGGHARTIMAGRRGDQPVDTGFIVYNRVNYPNLVDLFERLDVPVEASDMSFAASLDGGRIEYSLQTLDTLFAQRRNVLRPPFLRMVRDVLRWNARAADAANDPDLPLRDFIAGMGLGREFRDWYLGPISGAIWSTPSQDVMDFPAQAMVRFFENHALLSHTGQHQWFTVSGGSIEYVRRLEAHLHRAGVIIRTGAPVASVRRLPGTVEIRATGAEAEGFDEVVMATHSDIALRLLTDADPEETARLSDIRYQDNHAVLHADAGAMPRRRKVWAAWNYREEAGATDGRLGLTYWMNRLQNIPEDDPLFVTLNPTTPIRDAAIYDQNTFRHPVYDLAMMAAVERVKATQGHRNTWFCGAWMRNGFHEDGFASALEAVAALRASGAGAVAAA